jgi:hypothetical protein
LTQQLACLLQGSVVSCGQQYDFQMGSYFWEDDYWRLRFGRYMQKDVT